MLYNPEIKKLREQWFTAWLTAHRSYEREAILAFHQDTQKGAREHTLQMKRAAVKTISITSVEKRAIDVSMNYLSLI